eukprot:TRINITY_DN4700_c0_g1_i4.p1 TRINITY_DN4700_c0_g1~~TRINITY_DN4700_c0_g1_i4.p1  ORF type:complete len:1712 (-),score=613.88 TRINITY_DN4700_c0_g1_i4:86-5185(-)
MDSSEPNYASQATLFNDLGIEVLKNSWDGYNCCIFAYGQTGSGKSYSMLGYGEEKGIIPLLCEEMFERIGRSQAESATVLYKVEVSFMEIYNEKVKDLLNPKSQTILKVRNHPKIGPYVEDLSKIAVKSFAEIDNLMDEGTKARTVASTNMNATSSRSHAVFTIEFTQSKLDMATNQSLDRVSRINLVDLAGSERAASTGATGSRLKEGANINKSLSTLGKVIAALAANSGGGKKKEIHVPYRDSVLTWLLKESLGGNAKTIMIAALSPADINYGETLSTLRYADSAKQIKNKAVVNEDPTTRLIRDLRSEVEALRMQLIDSGGVEGGVAITKDKVVVQLKEELSQREKLIAEMQKTWEEKLKEAQTIQQERKAALQDMGVAIKAVSTLPHFINLNEDPLMSESLLYYLREGITRIGRSDTEVTQDIQLNGLSIAKEHCVVENKDGVVTIIPVIAPGSAPPAIFVNGSQITEPHRLTSGCRVVLGNNHIFRFNHPEEAAKARERGEKGKTAVIDWNFAIRELASTQGQLYFDDRSDASKEARQEWHGVPKEKRALAMFAYRKWREKVDKRKLKEKIMQVILLIKEANAISEAMSKDVVFELKLLSSFPGAVSADKLKKTEVGVRVTNTFTKATTVWFYETFMERLEELRDLYQTFLESGMTEELRNKQFDLHAEEQLIGVSHMYLKNLLYLFEIRRTLHILDNYGEHAGEMVVDIVPSVSEELKPSIVGSDIDPTVLLGKKIDFTVKIVKVENLTSKQQYTDIHCKYTFWETSLQTEEFTEGSIFNHEATISVEVTQDFLNYLEDSAVGFEVWGKSKTQMASTLPGNQEQAQGCDLFASINILEEEQSNNRSGNPSVVEVPVREAMPNPGTSEEQRGKEPSSIFLIRSGMKRRIVLELLKTTDPDVAIAGCVSAQVGNIRLKKPHGALPTLPSSSSSANLKSLLHTPPATPNSKEKEERAQLHVLEANERSVTVIWDVADHSSPLLTEKTLKGYYVSMSLHFNLMLKNFAKPVHVDIPIHFRVKEPDVAFKENNQMLEQFKELLKDRAPEEPRGSLFSVHLTKTEVDETSTIFALIDEHQQNVEKLGTALQIEKLKQELELHEKLSPRKDVSPMSKDKIEQQISTLRNEAKLMKLGSGRKRAPSASRLKTVAVEVSANSVRRDVEMSGFLRKKSSVSSNWKKRWFVLRRPYLYYYSNQQLEDEQVIDLANSAITVVQDDESAYTFGIVTWKRLWILQASNRAEMDRWMRAIDPSLNNKEEAELAELKDRVENMQFELDSKELEVEDLSTKLKETTDQLVIYKRDLEEFTSSISKNMDNLRKNLVIEKFESDKKNQQLRVLMQENEHQQRTLDDQNKQLDEFDKQAKASKELEEKFGRATSEIAALTKELETYKQHYREKEKQVEQQTATIADLQQNLQKANSELSSKGQVATLWEEATEELKNKHKNVGAQIDALTIKSQQDDVHIASLTEELRLLQTAVAEKDYKCELLAERLKSSEEDQKKLQLNAEQQTQKVQLQKEEIAAKNELLSDKFSVPLPAQEGWKLFGNSRAEFLEKQLVQNKKASLAHQTHNAFLNMEITRLEREMKLQVRLRELTIDRVKKEVALLRKRLFNISKDKAPIDIRSSQDDNQKAFEHLKRKFFCNLVIGVKMNLLNQGRSCNANAEQLYEQAISEGITNYEDFAEYVDTHPALMSEPIPM